MVIFNLVRYGQIHFEAKHVKILPNAEMNKLKIDFNRKKFSPVKVGLLSPVSLRVQPKCDSK